MIKELTIFNVTGSPLCRVDCWETIAACEECFRDLSEDIDFSVLKPRPWKWNQTPAAIKDEDIDYVGLYLTDDETWDADGCCICGIDRTHNNNVYLERNSVRARLRGQYLAHILYKELSRIKGKTVVDDMIYNNM